MRTLRNILVDELKFSEENYNRLMELTEVRTIKNKEMLLETGKICQFIGFVEEGVLRAYTEKDGEEFVGDFHVPGSFSTSYRSFITKTPSVGAIQVLKNAKVRMISKSVFENLLFESPLWYKFANYICETLYLKKCIKEQSLLMDSVMDRLNLFKHSYPLLEQSVAQYHIASYLGVQPESLSRNKRLDKSQ